MREKKIVLNTDRQNIFNVGNSNKIVTKSVENG